ncbi:hypothetical protein [Streptomyces sp. Amel2xC10]|uniref:hypothetical protein n=1 Tax=Streptomyces sp. Amel2xC10 TaxID=1305826 RepID=UPI000A09111D|nr:hypothetical protein [Streptomyces sp. Amel2xC10]SMF64531.1 hypothetical protein SAMN02745830_05010 [Streptomyces sp. Amel2xC10]
MTPRTRLGRPRLVASAAGRGPAVRAEYRHKLSTEYGVIRAGFLHPQTYRPYPPGAHVVLDVGDGNCMQVYEARLIGQALAHCASITVTGTTESNWSGVDGLGLVHGLASIADVISRAACSDASTCEDPTA